MRSKLLKKQIEEAVKPKIVVAGCVTRWSGTYYMLER
jgi:hypothetical protein